MKINKVIFSIIIISIMSVTLYFTKYLTNVNAASGNEGYAVYREPAFSTELVWHAGILTDPTLYNQSADRIIVHAPGFGNNVKYDTWANFMLAETNDDVVFKGTYRPNTEPSNYYRNLFMAMADRLVDEEIGYHVLRQVDYNILPGIGDWVTPDEVTNMRCDGVIEYIYEYYGFRIFGDDDNWDVTEVDYWVREKHAGVFDINPKIQARDYMTIVVE